MKAFTAAAYGLLGVILCWSRFVRLDRRYEGDELVTATDYVSRGPREILTGHYIPGNHELFSLLGWATTSLVGESAAVLRLWSVVPFILGVALVTAWLHVRVRPLAGVLFLFFATASPLLLDITRQARGYGLAFLAMSVLVVSALEAERDPRRTRMIVAFCAAGVVGTWTLPHFGIAFVATGAALLLNADLRRRTMTGLTATLAPILAWYGPHLDDLSRSSRQEYGARIETTWLLTAPIDQILIPAFVWIDEALLRPSLTSLAIVAALALVMGSSPLLRTRNPTVVLGAGVVATILTLWITRTYFAPRFMSFFLVPLFMLLASGAASILVRFATTRRPAFRALVALTTLVLMASISTAYTERVTSLPRDTSREAAATIGVFAPPTAPVFVYVPYPPDIAGPLGRPVLAIRTQAHARRACAAATNGAVVVTQPWNLPPVDIPCIESPGVRHVRLEQFARGGEINVWYIPPQT